MAGQPKGHMLRSQQLSTTAMATDRGPTLGAGLARRDVDDGGGTTMKRDTVKVESTSARRPVSSV